MKRKPQAPDPQQAQWDREDAAAGLQRLQAALAAKDAAEQRVADLARDLRVAKRQLKEAGWAVSAIMHQLRKPGS